MRDQRRKTHLIMFGNTTWCGVVTGDFRLSPVVVEIEAECTCSNCVKALGRARATGDVEKYVKNRFSPEKPITRERPLRPPPKRIRNNRNHCKAPCLRCDKLCIHASGICIDCRKKNGIKNRRVGE